ncbi:MAG: DNA mismatch repair protein MutS [Desulfobacteraceae bacterium]
MSHQKTTPMLQQYLAIKENHQDAILFYRMGDFYEMFFEDAHTASRVLEITLTSRNKNDTVPVPMCGVPYRAAQSYIARLIENGYKVAICDQIEDPSQAKGLVKREVVRVVTPGMIIENELLEAKSNNYLLSLALDRDLFGIAVVDISTGAFRVTETAADARIAEEIGRILPREVLLPADIQGSSVAAQVERMVPAQAINWLAVDIFDVQRGRERLTDQFQTQSLEGFGCQFMKAGLGAAGALLHYVKETQKQVVGHLHGIATYSLEDHLIVDHQSRQNLELEKNIRSGAKQGTLISILDKTATAMGGRLLKQWLRYPLRSAPEIGQRLDAVEEALGLGPLRREIAQHLESVYDLERLNSKIAMGHANARDLTALKKSIMTLPAIWQALEPLNSDLFRLRPDLEALLTIGKCIEDAIREDAPLTIQEGGMIRSGFDSELDELIQISRDSKGYLARLEVREKEATGISTLKVRFNKVFGYFIEVSKAQNKSVPDRYIRKQTLVNAERYITDELKQYETKVLGAEDRRCALELALFNQIKDRVKTGSAAIQAAAEYIARIDCLFSLAEIADRNDYCRPRINTRGVMDIRDGRHPVVEKMISGERFVPNSVHLDNESDQVLIITGPNMAGKSTVLRQVALTVIMAQMGSFVPASEADIALTDRIFTRVGALDNLSAGQSTFMVEMEETANILNNATARSLVIMDEIGRGTSTYDGLSIAWAVVEYLHDFDQSGVKTLFATHYHELVELAGVKARVRNFNIAVKEWGDKIIFLRKLIPGGTNRSYGIQVARLAGIPEALMQRAKEILARIEDHAPDGRRVGESLAMSADGARKPIQMDLFRSMENDIIARLTRIDVNDTTPLEALALLQELQDKIQKAGG